jgi:hypothetical protein
MSLSPVKCKILETLLLNEKPEKTQEIANEIGSEFKPVNMHLIGLTKAGYTALPTKGQYIITQKGKEALGITATSKECAKQILNQTPPEKAFHFYAAVHKPLNLYANGLKDFAEKTQTVDVASLDFHLSRGDFERWFISLGDAELAKKMALLKTKGIQGEQLKAKLREIAEKRCTALSALT